MTRRDFLASAATASVADPVRDAAAVRPTPQQLAWQRMELTAFVHFTVNTFTDKEWGDGTEDPRIFNPSALDARQWVRVLKDAGFRLVILTAKHHDGFCLWPSRLTRHSVASSPWREGKGDVVRDAADACREAGLKFGVYLSPWDRHEPRYGSAAYNDYYKSQLRELLTGYGEIFMVWFDGAKGKGEKAQQYDWPGYYSLIRSLQPDCLIHGAGDRDAPVYPGLRPDIRWVGNERGIARDTEWSVVAVREPLLHMDEQAADLGSRARLAGADRLLWWPAEADVSIRPGWFYHPREDGRVKPASKLVDIYFDSVGKNSVLLLNVPPDRRGLIHENDAAALKEFRSSLDRIFANNLVRRRRGLELEIQRGAGFNVAMLQEDIAQGQQVEEFTVEVAEGGAWREIARGTTIGYKRLLRFPEVAAERARVRVLASRGTPRISAVGLYREERS